MNNNLAKYYDPESFREQGHELVDFLAHDLRKQADSGKAFPYEKPDAILEFLKSQQFGDDSLTPASVIEPIAPKFFRTYSPTNVSHQVSVPSPASVLFAFSEAYFNASTPTFERSLAGNAIDRFVTDWLANKIGYGPEADGILTTGATLGNLTALLTARAVKGANVWTDGTSEQMAILVSEQAHYCIDKAVRTMGFGSKGIVKIKTNSLFKMDLDDLAAQYEQCKKEGINVLAVVGSACTTSTGSFDDLEAIAAFCEQNNLWFHVDGAHGGPAALSDKYSHLVKGISRADSVTIDLHKMLMSPNVATAVLYKNSSDSYKTFSQDAEYLFSSDSDEAYNFGLRTYECTKPASGIRLYGVLRMYGEEFFRNAVEQLFDTAKEFAAEVGRIDSLELLMKPSCNIVCFRAIKEGADLNELNKEIKSHIVNEGKFHISSTVLNGSFYLRVAIMNPLTEITHLKELLESVVANS